MVNLVDFDRRWRQLIRPRDKALFSWFVSGWLV